MTSSCILLGFWQVQRSSTAQLRAHIFLDEGDIANLRETSIPKQPQQNLTGPRLRTGNTTHDMQVQHAQAQAGACMDVCPQKTPSVQHRPSLSQNLAATARAARPSCFQVQNLRQNFSSNDASDPHDSTVAFGHAPCDQISSASEVSVVVVAAGVGGAGWCSGGLCGCCLICCWYWRDVGRLARPVQPHIGLSVFKFTRWTALPQCIVTEVAPQMSRVRPLPP